MDTPKKGSKDSKSKTFTQVIILKEGVETWPIAPFRFISNNVSLRVDYAMEKLYLVPIKKIGVAAMENWGLITGSQFS